MLSRALILAAVAFALGWAGTIPARAQNLEAGKSPSQIFSSTCSLCHKTSRGLLKSVSPGSLPGFLRQHYTTSSDMASAMSAYVLSNGAANAPVAAARQGQDAKGGPAPAAPPDAALLARQKAAAERRAARLAAKSKAEPPKIEDRHVSKDEAGKDTAAKPDDGKPEPADAEPAKSESGKTETAKVDGTRPDPVPAVTPAPKDGDAGPKEAEKPAAVASAPPKDDVPSGPLTIDMGPPPAPRAAAAGSGAVPAGKPEPPISR